MDKDTTIQDVEAALEKQTPMKVDVETYFYGYLYYCPRCKINVATNAIEFDKELYCRKCGQALDWSEV